jgi:hypothetical protein
LKKRTIDRQQGQSNPGISIKRIKLTVPSLSA